MSNDEFLSGGTRYSPPPTDHGDALAEGELFDARYRIEKTLGGGGMGIVYLAHDKTTDRRVVIKLIRPELAAEPSAIERLREEGIAARDIRHPNIVSVYDVGEANDSLYLSMEYLQGETLRTWLSKRIGRDEPVSLETAVDILRQILAGLGEAHRRGVIHRDVSPENVMLLGDPEAGDYQLKILDFGIARAAGSQAQLTTAGSSMGKPIYMAPEQRVTPEAVTPAADLYSVTAIFYELLLDTPPEGHWSPPSECRDDLPKSVDAIITKGLNNYAKKRFQSAAEYLDALNRLDEKAPVPPPPPPNPSPNHETRKKPANKKVSYTIAAILGIGVIAALDDEYGDDPAIDPPAVYTDPVTPMPSPLPPAAVAAVPNIAGTWFSDNGFRVDLTQAGNSFSGQAWVDATNQYAGVMQGEVNGRVFEYDFTSVDGTSGHVSGIIQPDGTHIPVSVSVAGGESFTDTLHKGHRPR